MAVRANPVVYGILVRTLSQPPAWLGILLVCAFLALLYHPVLSYPFVWTDHAEVEQEALVPTSLRELGDTFIQAKGVAKGTARDAYKQRPDSSRYAFYRPIKAATYGFDWQMGGGHPWSFHLTNLLLHAGCSILLLFLGRRLWGKRTPWLAEGLALLHAVHPLHVEAVCWISARSDVLWGLFTLTGAMAILKGRTASRALSWRLIAGLSVLLAAGSKESGIVSAGILMLISALVPLPEHGLDGRPSAWKRVVAECWAPVGAAGVYLVVRLLVVSDIQIGLLGDKPGPGGWTLLHLFGLNLLQSFLPIGLRVADTLEVVTGPTWLGILGTLAWLAWLILGIRLRREQPILLLTALGWLLAVAPVSQLVPLLHARGERYLYVPSFFSQMLLVWALASLVVRANAPIARLGSRGARTLAEPQAVQLPSARLPHGRRRRARRPLAPRDEPGGRPAAPWSGAAALAALFGHPGQPHSGAGGLLRERHSGVRLQGPLSRRVPHQGEPAAASRGRVGALREALQPGPGGGVEAGALGGPSPAG